MERVVLHKVNTVPGYRARGLEAGPGVSDHLSCAGLEAKDWDTQPGMGVRSARDSAGPAAGQHLHGLPQGLRHGPVSLALQYL